MSTERIRIAFQLDQDESGWPPASSETLWAVRVAAHEFRVANPPWFVRDVAVDDIVEAAENDEGILTFKETLEDGGHSTLRVFGDNPPELVQGLRDRLARLGCESELSHVPGLFAVDVPPAVALNDVEAVLEQESRAGSWDYEVSAISSAHDAT